MKRFIITLLCITMLCSAIFYLLAMPPGVSGRRAEGGVFDMSALSPKGMIFALDGEWEFYYGRQYTSADLARGVDGGALISVPSS